MNGLLKYLQFSFSDLVQDSRLRVVHNKMVCISVSYHVTSRGFLTSEVR